MTNLARELRHTIVVSSGGGYCTSFRAALADVMGPVKCIAFLRGMYRAVGRARRVYREQQRAKEKEREGEGESDEGEPSNIGFIRFQDTGKEEDRDFVYRQLLFPSNRTFLESVIRRRVSQWQNPDVAAAAAAAVAAVDGTDGQRDGAEGKGGLMMKGEETEGGKGAAAEAMANGSVGGGKEKRDEAGGIPERW